MYVHGSYMSGHSTDMFYSEFHLQTVLYQVQTMLWYRNLPFGIYRFQTRIYTSKTALAGGKLSCGISSKQCLSAAEHCTDMSEHCTDMSVPNYEKCSRKLTTCQSHSWGVWTCLNTVCTKMQIPVP